MINIILSYLQIYVSKVYHSIYIFVNITETIVYKDVTKYRIHDCRYSSLFNYRKLRYKKTRYYGGSFQDPKIEYKVSKSYCYYQIR